MVARARSFANNIAVLFVLLQMKLQAHHVVGMVMVLASFAIGFNEPAGTVAWLVNHGFVSKELLTISFAIGGTIVTTNRFPNWRMLFSLPLGFYVLMTTAIVLEGTAPSIVTVLYGGFYALYLYFEFNDIGG